MYPMYPMYPDFELILIYFEKNGTFWNPVAKFDIIPFHLRLLCLRNCIFLFKVRHGSCDLEVKTESAEVLLELKLNSEIGAHPGEERLGRDFDFNASENRRAGIEHHVMLSPVKEND